VSTTQWQEVQPSPPMYFFVPQEDEAKEEYEQYTAFTDIFSVISNGFKTHRDHFAVDFSSDVLLKRASEFQSKNLDNEQIEKTYNLSSTSSWHLANSRQELRKEQDIEAEIVRCSYRPFDFRWVIYHSAIVERQRYESLRHFLSENKGIAVGRQGQVVGSGQWNLVFCGNLVADTNLFYRGGIQYAPLYLYPDQSTLSFDDERRPNFHPSFLQALGEKLGLPLEGEHGLPRGLSPEDIFHYAYAIFHSPQYRARYAPFLKTDFPRLPLTSDLSLFGALAAQRVRAIGQQFANLSTRKNIPYSYTVLQNNEVLNAFAAPGGPIFVTTKLVETAANDAELAYVIGHETAHIERKHIVNAVEKQQRAKPRCPQRRTRARRWFPKPKRKSCMRCSNS
jgi:predicted helicase